MVNRMLLFSNQMTIGLQDDIAQVSHKLILEDMINSKISRDSQIKHTQTNLMLILRVCLFWPLSQGTMNYQILNKSILYLFFVSFDYFRILVPYQYKSLSLSLSPRLLYLFHTISLPIPFYPPLRRRSHLNLMYVQVIKQTYV